MAPVPLLAILTIARRRLLLRVPLGLLLRISLLRGVLPGLPLLGYWLPPCWAPQGDWPPGWFMLDEG